MIRRKVLVIILTLFLLICFAGCNMGIISKVSAGEETINTRAELYRKVEQSLKNGKTEISFETSKLEKEDFEYLNKEHDGFYGTVSSYKIRSFEFLDKSFVTLYCDIYDNYYVENAILKGDDIPRERKEARKLLAFCEKLLPQIEAGDPSDYRKEKRIHDYLVGNIEYGYMDGDNGDDSNAYSSYGALIEKKAVCNGYAQAMKLLCDLTGVPCQMISGLADGENHAWNLVELNNEWYHVDATWDDPEPDEPGRIFYHYFNVNDEFISEDHSWEEASYTLAEGKTYNYFQLNNLACRNFEEFRERCEDVFEDDKPEAFQIQVKNYDKDIYSEENLQFLFMISGADSLNMHTVGKGSCTTLYITLTY